MLPEIPGQLVQDRAYLQELRDRVCHLLKAEFNSRKFPGAQPISFESTHLKELTKENYFVSEKADGIRCLLFTRTLEDGSVESYLIDRKNNYYRQKFGLPLPGLKKAHRNSILDGELVIEQKRGQEELLFLFFDALLIDEKLLIDREYTSRLGYLRTYVIDPYMKSCQRNPQYYKIFPFKLRQKRLELAYNMGLVFDHMKKYQHKTDGVIFTSAVAPYILGTCQKMLKWKPADENTVDFKISVQKYEDRLEFSLGILVRDDEYQDFGYLHLEDERRVEWEQDPPNGRIVECRYDPDWPNHWRFSRWRDDKLTANHISVYDRIMQSIADNVTEEQLLDSVEEIFKCWRERDPKAKPIRKD